MDRETIGKGYYRLNMPDRPSKSAVKQMRSAFRRAFEMKAEVPKIVMQHESATVPPEGHTGIAYDCAAIRTWRTKTAGKVKFRPHLTEKI